MPVRKKTFADDELVVCIESFGSSDLEYPSVSRGARFRGADPRVRKWPMYFVPVNTDDVAILRARQRLYKDAGAAPPVA
jgi:hypothetical protein